jgi:hypothetical protein
VSRRKADYSETMGLYRHGDVLIARVSALPAPVRARGGAVLARGELTGHAHRIAEAGAAELYEDESGTLFLVVVEDTATLVHEEHAAIQLPRGTYRVWRQREYTPERIVPIAD